MNKRKNRILVCVWLIVFMLSVSVSTSLFTSLFTSNYVDLEGSGLNTLFNGKSYPFELNDVYDDENYTKIYTDAYLQTEYNQNGTIFNDTVTVVNNTCYKSPSNTDVSMINGTFDDTDNMKANDGSHSNFTSTEVVLPDDEFIDSLDFTLGSVHEPDLPLSKTNVDDGNYVRFLRSDEIAGFWYIDVEFLFDPVVGGRDFYISCHLSTADSISRDLKINGENWKTGTNMDFDDELVEGVNSISYYAVATNRYLLAYLYYFKIVEKDAGIPATLNFTVDFNFNEVDASKLLALDVSSHHYTNTSTTIVGNVYDYDSGTYTQMFSSSNTAETENYFMDNISVSNYLNNSGNLRLQFKGINANNPFKLSIDYVKVRFYYKMDVTIDKTFYVNGLWRYRFKLIGSLHYTDWTIFEVVDPPPNFYAISESELTTRWILQDNELTAVEDFHDDINTDYWNLVDASNIKFDYEVITTGDAYVYNHEGSDNNYGSIQYLWTEWTGTTSEYKYRSHLYFPNLESNYLFTNQTGLDKIRLYTTSIDYAGNVYCNDTSSFSEGTITWNNAPTGITLQDTTYISSTGYNYWEVSDLTGYYVLYTVESGVDRIRSVYRSKEYGSNKPTFIRYDVNKNYFGSGYMYMQTDTTELISLKSDNYGTYYNLSSGDYFEVDFQTSSDSKINLILLKDGAINKTLTLSPSGNTNFNRHTAKISVDELVEFDQLKISSTFEDTDNVKVYDVETRKYALTGDYANFLVGSKRDREIYLTPDVYNLRIEDYSSRLNLVNENITIPATGVKDYVYTPIARLECRLDLFNIGKERHLDFVDYHITINRSLNGFYDDFELLESIFSVDEETYIYISVYDRFDALIDTFERVALDYIDLEIEVYSLQIKNLMTERTTLDINGTHTYPLLSGDSIYFTLSAAHYQIGYYDTNDVYKQFTIFLNDNMAFELNRSKICFLSYADQQGTHLFFENYKTYINDSLLYENMFYREIGDNIGIEIKDRYGVSIKNETYTVVSGDNYIPITLTMYSLKVMSQQLCFNHINITRDPVHYESEMYWSEWIAPGEIIDFRLFAGYYKINITNNEDGAYSYYSYTLSGDDVLLISSNNTLYNVLVNIANVNTTIGNQITNVQIDLTNQNSNINNTIINIEINLGNINSSLGTVLVSIDTAISNINTSIINEIVSLGTVINNVNTSIANQILDIGVDITNMNSSITSQLLTLGVDISNINGSIVNQIIDLGVDVSNFNTSLSNQILSVGVDLSNVNTSVINQILSMVADIENVNSTIHDQILVMLADISNTNSTLLNQMIDLGVDISNVNTSIINQILSLGVDISNLDTSITNQIVSLGVDLANINTTITDQILSLGVDITNINTSIIDQILTLGVDISNINGSIVNQIIDLGVNVSNFNTSLSNQILSIGVDISNVNTSIIEQILLVVADIENIETVIDDQTLVMLADISNINSTLLNQMIELGVDVLNINTSISNQILSLNVDLTNVNATIYNQILSLNVDLTNINATITNLLFYLDVEITNIANNIGSFYSFTNTSFINLNNVMNTSFIYIENNIISINQSISNLVIGVSNDIYLINGTISTMITQLETNLLLMNVSINTSLFNLNTTISLIGSNITSNYILLNNSINLTNLNINDSRIAMINNLLLINNTISTLIADVYSAVYLVNNSIYTAVLDLGTYLSIVNNTISSNLSIVLEQNKFLTEIYQMTMLSELLNWTDIGLNTSLLTSQIDAWEFVNNYKNQSVEIHLRYQDIIDNLTVSAQNTLEQYLPRNGTDYREWSIDLQEYVGEWKPLPDNRTISFGFFEEDIPTDPEPIVNTFITYLIVVLFSVGLAFGALKLYYGTKERKNEVPSELVNLTSKPHKKKQKGVVDNRL